MTLKCGQESTRDSLDIIGEEAPKHCCTTRLLKPQRPGLWSSLPIFKHAAKLGEEALAGSSSISRTLWQKDSKFPASLACVVKPCHLSTG